MFLEISQNSQKNTGARPANLLKKKTLAQVFFCGFCETSKNIFFKERLWTPALANFFGNFQNIFEQLHCTKNEVFP